MNRGAGFSFVEVAVVALIAGTAMVFVLSLGRANVQLSAVNEESLLARQVVLDLVEYYAHHVVEAKRQSSGRPQSPGLLRTHPVLKDALTGDTLQLFNKMKPEVFVRVEEDLDRAGKRHPDLHRLTCQVRWAEGGKKGTRTLSVSRLVAEPRR